MTLPKTWKRRTKALPKTAKKRGKKRKLHLKDTYRSRAQIASSSTLPKTRRRMLQQALPKTGVPRKSKTRYVVEVAPDHDRIGLGGNQVTYQLERVKCGKDNCKRCSRGPGHGPYWYAYWTERNKTRTLYIGKKRRPAREALAARNERKQREIEI